MTRARTTTVLLGALLAATVAGCAPQSEPAATGGGAAADCAPGALPTLAQATLTIGTDQPVYPPWYLDDDPASGRGFESAVAYAVADELGYPRDRVAWVRVPFNAAIQPGPKSYDLNLTEFSITEERRRAVDFSSPYYDVRQAVVALKTSPLARATTVAQLKEARLGAQIGTTSLEQLNTSVAPTTPAAVYNTNDDGKLALSNGQIDGLVVDLPTAFQIVGSDLPEATIVGQLPAGGTPEQFGAVLDKDSPLTACVSGAVDRLRDTGALAGLERQWIQADGAAPELR
ncbi:transporter substrate-binding domain-containing protein [Pseudonocardia tropica]|uniref:Transporter substrate-binding domain-containing protein n=1 Tax=Pseudonocardia tropica TaxID=681289 RepID=A0ABV1K070_9PSEU